MDIDNAAKYFIVAWIKDWRMRVLLDVLDQKTNSKVTQERIDACHEKYPFMPNELHAYLSGKGKGIMMKPYVAKLSRKLNDALWATDDNLKKLSFHTYVKTLKFKDLPTMSNLSKEEKREKAKDIKEYRESYGGYMQSRTAFKLRQGRDWFTVK